MGVKIMNVSPININTDDKKYNRVKLSSAVCSVAGVSGALAHIAKKQGFSLKPSHIKNTPVKDWAIFRMYNKNNPAKKIIELEEKEILELASASVAGGLAGGLAVDDKKYNKSKIRESVNQLLGNVTVPILCVGGTSRMYKKYKDKILAKVPQIKETGKISARFNKALKAVPFSLATVASLGIGIFAGNRVSNFLNEKVFKKEVDRKVKGTDFAPHVDDLGVAVTLMADRSKFSSFVQRIVPAFLCVPGYEVGIHRD